MKNTLLTIVFALCFLPPVAGQIPANKPTTPEQSGDENTAAGKFVEALSDYTKTYDKILITYDSTGSREAEMVRVCEKIAAVLKKLGTAPPIPDDAEFHAQKGLAFFKLAKTPADFMKAQNEFTIATTLAAWVFDYHYNLAIARKGYSDFAGAISSVKLAKIVAQNEKDRRDANALRAEIEAAQEMTASSKAESEKQSRTAERLSWPQELVKKLQAGYSSTAVNELRMCWPSLGRAVCNEEQAKGSNWQVMRQQGLNLKLSFELVGEDIRARFAYDDRTFCGTVSGPAISDIRWHGCGSGGDKYPAEIEFAQSNGGKPFVSLVYSCDTSRICKRDSFVLD